MLWYMDGILLSIYMRTTRNHYSYLEGCAALLDIRLNFKLIYLST